MNRFFLPFAIPLALLTACGEEEVEPPRDVLVQTCDYPMGVTLSEFDSSGALHWTDQAADGHLTVRFCDPTNVYRVVEVTGLMPGESVDWQSGAATDAARRVVHFTDLAVIATLPTPSPRLTGVTIQCLSQLASCEPAPEPPAPAPGT